MIVKPVAGASVVYSTTVVGDNRGPEWTARIEVSREAADSSGSTPSVVHVRVNSIGNLLRELQ